MSLQYKLYRVGVEALYAPVIWPSLIVYAFKRRDRVFRADMEKFCEVELHGARPGFGSFWRLMVWYTAFRNVFYYRVGYASILFKFWMKEDKTLRLNTLSIGEGYISSMGPRRASAR